MKKILFTFCVVLVATLGMAFADDSKEIDALDEGKIFVINDESQLPAPILDENGNLAVRRKFIIEEENTESSRAICYKCGKPGLGLVTQWEEYSGRTISCPMNDLVPDVLTEYQKASFERCTYCGHRLFLGYSGQKWKVFCYNPDRIVDVWDVIIGATISQGYDPHQCVRP